MRSFLLLVLILLTTTLLGADRPSVVLVITDDQGYGDIAAHGNTVIKTPKLDSLHDEAIRFTHFHANPNCSPTRAALLTGRDATRVGIWSTLRGRSLLRKNEIIMPQLFVEAGYKTGLFGKWHLGDNYPYRPQDRGFQETFYHPGGGVTQTADHWGNTYFDDTYYRNGVPEKTQGYCTDVWFSNAVEFVKKHRNEPFFLYIATNAPHVPWNIDEKYWKPYVEKGLAEPLARFYGMITNIDENLQRLDKALHELGLAENTIFIFMTDNGSDGRAFNAGMRGYKATMYEGGHRVPFFFRWPKGNFGDPRNIGTLAAHIDVLPTLIDLCGLRKPENVEFDGMSLLPLLRSMERPGDWPDRGIGIELNWDGMPRPWIRSCYMTQRWRLIDGVELYDIEADPGQKTNIAEQQPDVVKELRDRYLKRWPSIMQNARDWSRIPIGHPEANPMRLCVHDWDGVRVPPYHEHIESTVGDGRFAVDVERSGRYRFRLRLFPEESGLPLQANRAALVVQDQRWERDIPPMTDGKPTLEAVFDVDLKKGATWVETELDNTEEGIYRGAFYVYVEYLENAASK